MGMLEEELSNVQFALNQVRGGLHDRLLDIYVERYDLEFAQLLSTEVVNAVFSDPAEGWIRQEFAMKNRPLIEAELSVLSEDRSLCLLLTAAVTTRSHIRDQIAKDEGKPLWGAECIEKLHEFNIFVPDWNATTNKTFQTLALKFMLNIVDKEKGKGTLN